MKTYSIVLLLCLLTPYLGNAQENFIFKKAYDLKVLGRVSEDTSHFQRIDSADLQNLPPAVQRYAKFSAGMNVVFKTDSKSIKIHWKLKKMNTLWNMPSVAVNGIDLYGWNGQEWQYISSGRPNSEDNQMIMVENLDGKMRNYRIFLPIYAEVKDLEIGVLEKTTLSPPDTALVPSSKIAIYGSSITQGIAASRPGMAYPSILSRRLDFDFINLGFSGSGKMELPIADLLAKIPAQLYILDCVPNTLPEQVKDRAYPLITRLRMLKPEIPIIMVESVKREISNWNSAMYTRVNGQNDEYRKTFDKLVAEGYQNIYYISTSELMGDDHEATVDGTHLTDLGFMRISKTIERYIKDSIAPLQ
ncbi:SGNH/GDSL hydrolase family protein [Sphingobacterium paucimobilis]|uniref:Hydrolase n=1 Tax=Sphingobacterium paucimobilis HER1398 TaxID=1346330 RepID=U2J7U3_9SPHI|nr:SGNH/GDSL hydrolase family protein [Sphingobacterium paucimobilis]ERJ58723.1 hypothetical protein M472_08075 [Sphingobacterium paucimobilis HER1398]